MFNRVVTDKCTLFKIILGSIPNSSVGIKRLINEVNSISLKSNKVFWICGDTLQYDILLYRNIE